jgi:SAM-dependent methyltransferase
MHALASRCRALVRRSGVLVHRGRVLARDLAPAIWKSRRGKGTFVRAIPERGRVLDVGCGNDSPRWFKHARPDLYYVGIDIEDYHQSAGGTGLADEYVLTTPSAFAGQIGRYRGQMDAVVSSHNLEHCEQPQAVLASMLGALKPGGRLYLSFPCEESVSFPRRGGCLNFYDDSTHRRVPSWKDTLQTIEQAGFDITYAAKRYRPPLLAAIGLLLEPLSAWRREVIRNGATWALYGFESVIWARAPSGTAPGMRSAPAR